MTISYNWLHDYLPQTLAPERLSQILTAIGLEVEKMEPYEAVKGNLDGLVIGEVLEAVPHPNADKLRLTKVATGVETLQIVCGAPNVAAGQKVVVATVGTTIYPTTGAPPSPSTPPKSLFWLQRRDPRARGCSNGPAPEASRRAGAIRVIRVVDPPDPRSRRSASTIRCGCRRQAFAPVAIPAAAHDQLPNSPPHRMNDNTIAASASSSRRCTATPTILNTSFSSSQTTNSARAIQIRVVMVRLRW